MAGTTNFPTSLDNNSTLNETLEENVDFYKAEHVNNLAAAVKALQVKVGINSSADDDSIDYFLRERLGWSGDGDDPITIPDYVDFVEVAAPTGVANSARLFARDNGSGKTQLCVIFGSGAVQVLATEP